MCELMTKPNACLNDKALESNEKKENTNAVSLTSNSDSRGAIGNVTGQDVEIIKEESKALGEALAEKEALIASLTESFTSAEMKKYETRIRLETHQVITKRQKGYLMGMNEKYRIKAQNDQESSIQYKSKMEKFWDSFFDEDSNCDNEPPDSDNDEKSIQQDSNCDDEPPDKNNDEKCNTKDQKDEKESIQKKLINQEYWDLFFEDESPDKNNCLDGYISVFSSASATEREVKTYTEMIPDNVLSKGEALDFIQPTKCAQLLSINIPDKNELQTKWGFDRIDFLDRCTIPNVFDQQISPQQEEEEADKKTISNGKIAPPSPSRWSVIPGSKFKVRAGPKYSKNKTKLHSKSSLYQTAHCYAFSSQRRTPQNTLLGCFPLPLHKIFPNKVLPNLQDDRVPHLLIIHFQLPYEIPTMLSKNVDGKGGEIIFYLVPSQRFCDESNEFLTSPAAATVTTDNCSTSGNSNAKLSFSSTIKNLESKIIQNEVSAATKLFTKWCTKCETSKEWMSRFKCIGVIRDIDKMSSLKKLKSFNGKPVLISESGSVKNSVTSDGIRILEMSINALSTFLFLIISLCTFLTSLIATVHKWSLTARKGFLTLVPKLKSIGLELGFTIEAVEDNEMPECILGSILVDCLDPTALVDIPSFFQEPPQI